MRQVEEVAERTKVKRVEQCGVSVGLRGFVTTQEPLIESSTVWLDSYFDLVRPHSRSSVDVL